MYNLTTQLTPREAQVLRLVAQGYHPRPIAAHLQLQPRTVREVLDTLRSRLWLPNLAALRRYAQEHGLA